MKFGPQLLRIVAGAAVLAPFALSVAAHAVGDAPASGNGADRPALAFREYLLNLGRIPEGRPVPGRFWFFNAGDGPLTILGFTPSCGCLTPRLDKTTYAAGEQGTFLVVADTAGEGSDRADRLKQHHIDVEYDAGDGPQTARIHVKFVLPARRIDVEPRTLLVYQIGEVGDKPMTREITVTDRRTPPVTVTGVECASDALSVETRLAESLQDPSRATIAVTIPADLDEGVSTFVTIRTDDREQPAIHVPIVVQVRKPGPTSGE